jgi:hypothetical protein
VTKEEAPHLNENPEDSMIIVQNEYVIVEHDPARSLLHFARTKRPYPLTAAFIEAIQPVIDVFDQLSRAQHKLLIDMREAPLRNDEGFESFAAPSLDRVFGGFAKTAILVRTAVGELQFSRLRREGKMSALESIVFRDEAAALAYLQVT